MSAQFDLYSIGSRSPDMGVDEIDGELVMISLKEDAFYGLNDWHDPVKLDKFGCEYFLSLNEDNTHKAQSEQTPPCRTDYPHFAAGGWRPNGGRDLSRA